MIDYTNNAPVITTTQTFHRITGLQRGQRYNITVTALDASRSVINSFTCSGETGKDCISAVFFTLYVVDQSMNQSTSQSINQSVNQPVNQSVNQ